jgi:predicted TIM-barrel enzyme
MVERFTRQEILGRLKREIEKGQAIFDAFAGTGISAKFAEVGGADMITTHILARFRMAGLLGADPTRNMDYFLDEVIAAGFSGILNCPTLALIDGNFRKTLEETGVTYDKEVEMMAIAHRKGLYTKAFCTTPKEAQKMLEAGCDNIIAHGGNTSGGSIGSKTVTSLDGMVGLVQNIIDLVKSKNWR